LIRERRAGGLGRDDLLALLLRAHDGEAGPGMSDRQLRDEAVTLLLTSHETIALVLSWTCYLMAGHPEAEAQLQAEWADLGGRPPTAADVPRLRFTDQVVSESMRPLPAGVPAGPGCRRGLCDRRCRVGGRQC
jgi:cytochrome P450